MRATLWLKTLKGKVTRNIKHRY